MLLTFTINPAIDRTVTVDRLVYDDRAYILSTSESAGGRGINASCVIHAFGGDTRAIAAAGGDAGRRFQTFLCTCGFPVDIVEIAAGIRENLTITDKQGLTVKLNHPGPPITEAELERIEEVVRHRLVGARWLLICGSVPPGVPGGLYSRLVRMARDAGVNVLLDTDGDPLVEGIEAEPTVVAPNKQEAERLLNTALVTRGHFFEAAARIRRMGAENVIVSLGSRGAVGAFGGGIIEVVPPQVDAVCPIGAGDALAAAFVWAMDGGRDFPDAVRWAVAAGTASAMLPGVTFANLDQTKQMYPRVEVRQAG